jgi:hypothetical protein
MTNRMDSMQQSSSFASRGNAGRSRTLRLGALALAVGCVLVAWQSPALAGARDQAKRINDRINGTPPSSALLDAMTAKVQAGDPAGAAMLAMDPANAESRGFYNSKLKNLAMPWTNRDQTMFAPLNDYVATFIGMVRDDVGINTALSDDIIYTGNTAGAPAYSPANNDHYQFLEDNDADLRTALVRSAQSSKTGIPAAATAGLITTRAASQAFFINGTNRAMFRFTMLNHLCHDMETVQDTTRPPDRIRQDVSRSPGGDSRVFLNTCIGCHSGMDPMAQAFAYYNFDATQGQLVYTGSTVQPKYTINSDNFKPGFVTPSDHWDNRWRQGPNASLGWSTQLTGTGDGAKSLGAELGNSNAFASCQVEKVFKAVCFRAPADAAEQQKLVQITASFKANGYKLKDVFAQTAAACMGD